MPLDSLSKLCTPDDLILPEPSSNDPRHRPLEISIVTPLIMTSSTQHFQQSPQMIMSSSTQHFQPSSKLNLSPFMSVSQPSTHEHRIVSMYLFDRHPNWPLSAYSDGSNGVKGATKEDKSKNKAQRAWTSGPDGSISMGQRKVKPIPCIEHYLK